MDEQTRIKVEKYEQFVNDKLKTDLKRVLDEQDVIYSEIAEYLKIKETLEKLSLTQKTDEQNKKIKLRPITTKVDLGCNFYANAQITDPSKIFIAIGYGFFLEMTHPEALKFIEKKTKVLNNSADELRVKACEIKANIKFVLEGLKEIQSLNYFTPSEK